MAYEYWEDAQTALFREKQPEIIDPQVGHEVQLWNCEGGPFLLNNKNRERFRRGGPFKPPYYPASLIEDRYVGYDAFVFAPGPSMADVDLSIFKGKLTLVLNSGGFKFVDPAPLPFFWCIFESEYMYWFRECREIPPSRVYLMSARCALPWREADRTSRMRAAFVPRWEEEKVIPPRAQAVCMFGALIGAWEMGCRRAFVVGMDQSKPGRPYVEGVPYTPKGAANPFDDQIKSLRQFRLPDFEVFNASPHSQHFGFPFTKIDVREVEKIARDSPNVAYPAEIGKV